MPIRVRTINEAERTFTLELMGESASITYRLGNFQQAFISKTWAGALAAVVVAWDILGDDDKPVPLTEAAIEQALIPQLREYLYGAIQRDAEPGNWTNGTATAVPSAAGLRRASS